MPQLIVAPLTSVFAGFGLGATASLVAANLTASLIFSAASKALGGKGQSQPDLLRGLQLPNSLPPKRTVYGKSRVYGSWAPGWVVQNGVLYGCLIFNSRPSDGGDAAIFLDKRAVTLTGDLFDFATGASATNAPFAGYAKFWMGRGDQVSPPDQIMAEVGDITGVDQSKFWSTDGWRGLTVLWVRLDRGPNASRAERWPRTPPEVEMLCKWSQVYDPRDIAQDADDAATWVWSANQGLCLLDALRNNPIRKRALRQIHLDSMIDAADVADMTRPRQTGGPEPRFECNGVIIWSASELIDQLMPLVRAGGGNLFQSGGALGYAAAIYRPPLRVVSDALTGQPFKFTRTVPGRDLPRAVRAQFVDPSAQWEVSDLVPYPVPGAGGYSGDDDGVQTLDLSMVTSATQAMQLQKIAAITAGLQKRFSCELPPSELELISGSAVEIAFPREGDLRNDIYMVTQTHPAHWLGDSDSSAGVAFRMPIEMRQISAGVYDWDSSEETAVISTDFTPINLALSAPSDLTASYASPIISFSFDPYGSDASGYEWQWKLDLGDWITGGSIAADYLDGFGRVNGRLTVSANGDYLIQVRAVAGSRVSGWVALASAITVTDF